MLADLNQPYEERMQRLLEKCAPAIAHGFLRHFRRHVPDTDGFDSWHASVGKNSAAMCGVYVESKSILVGLDGDNFISKMFFKDIFDAMHDLTSGRCSGIRWRHPSCPPCTGRMRSSAACPREVAMLGIRSY